MVWVFVCHGSERYHAQIVRSFEGLLCRLVKAICYLLDVLCSPVAGVPQFVWLPSANLTRGHLIATHL